MDNIAIVTDTTADIPAPIAREYSIAIIPLYVGYEGKLYKEGKEITSDDVYKKLEAGIKVNTSTPSAIDFVNLYDNLINNEKKTIIYSIHLSSKLSGTVNSANQAKKFFPNTKIKVIDSKNVTISLGLIVLEVAKAVKIGFSEEKIDHLIDILIEKSKFFGAIENFEHLFKGGRAPFLGKFLSSAIRFKPIISIDRNGKIKLIKFARSKESATIELYKLAKKVASAGKNEIGIFFGANRNDTISLEKMVRDDNDIEIDELIMTEITPIMSAHTGPGIWGIGICPKVDMHKL